jgi:hypothetical protein
MTNPPLNSFASVHESSGQFGDWLTARPLRLRMLKMPTHSQRARLPAITVIPLLDGGYDDRRLASARQITPIYIT